MVDPASSATRPLTFEEAIRAAQHMQRHGDLENAEKVYQRILEVIPEEPNALHYLGVLRHQRGDNIQADAMIRRAIAVVPLDPGPWINLGNVLLEARRFDDAVDAYRRAAELAPDNLLVYNNLGLLQSRRNNWDLAEAAFQHALMLAPDAEYVLNNYARLLHSQGRYEEATAYSLRTLTVSPQNHKAYRLLSISYSLLGDFESAQTVLNKWLALEPENAEAAHLLAGAGGLPTPARASNAYITEEFDGFAASFDAKLEILGYKAPELIGAALQRTLGVNQLAGDVLDAGCGTGLCSIQLRPLARRLDGVDLSSGMLAKARQRGGYDQLDCAELCAFMNEHPERWDTIVSADTLCYFGDLTQVMIAASVALRENGLLLFSVEACESKSEDFVLQYNGRYAHSRAYVAQCVQTAGLSLLSLAAQVLRAEVMRPVRGWVVVARLGLN